MKSWVQRQAEAHGMRPGTVYLLLLSPIGYVRPRLSSVFVNAHTSLRDKGTSPQLRLVHVYH